MQDPTAMLRPTRPTSPSSYSSSSSFFVFLFSLCLVGAALGQDDACFEFCAGMDLRFDAGCREACVLDGPTTHAECLRSCAIKFTYSDSDTTDNTVERDGCFVGCAQRFAGACPGGRAAAASSPAPAPAIHADRAGNIVLTPLPGQQTDVGPVLRVGGVTVRAEDNQLVVNGSALNIGGLGLGQASAQAPSVVGAPNGSLVLRHAPGADILVNGAGLVQQLDAVRGLYVSCSVSVGRWRIDTAGQSNEPPYAGAVVARNNKIYLMPAADHAVAIFDPSTRQVGIIPLTLPFSSVKKWLSAVLAQNDVIVGIPFEAQQVLLFYPANNESRLVEVPTSDGSDQSAQRWSGGVLAPNGLVFGVPFNADKILAINPSTLVVDLISFSATHSPPEQWAGGVLAPNGKLYFIPYSSPHVLVFNSSTNETSRIPLTVPPKQAWAGGVLANGKIYGMPSSATSVLIINPSTETADTTSIANLPGDADKWSGGVLGSSGLIYGIPNQTPSILILDPASGSVTTTMLLPECGSDPGAAGTANGEGCAGAWSGGVLVGGRIYAAPVVSANILELSLVCRPASRPRDL